MTCIIGRLACEGPNQKLRIVDYEQEEEGQRAYPRPVYSPGVGPPIKKPKAVPRQVLKNEYWRAGKMRTVSSVFDLGIPIRLRLKGRRTGA